MHLRGLGCWWRERAWLRLGQVVGVVLAGGSVNGPVGAWEQLRNSGRRGLGVELRARACVHANARWVIRPARAPASARTGWCSKRNGLI